jgi:hypothetical protein
MHRIATYRSCTGRGAALILAGAIGVSGAQAADYYLSPAGSDTNSGALSKPWKTIDKVNSHANSPGFVPGDTIRFLGGTTFAGHIYFDGTKSAGAASQPITLTSYGTGRAVLDAGAGAAFYAYNGGGYAMTDLDFKGSGSATNTATGVSFYTDFADGRKLPALTVERCSISGFGKEGLSIGSWHTSYPGWDGITIVSVAANDNGKTGIFTYDMAGKTDTAYAHRNLLITDCEAARNQNGSGIIVCGVDGGTVQYCYAHDNYGEGGVGIWTYSARAVTIQGCIGKGHRITTNDGCGYDLDGGSENCVIQYCYSYDNDGHGYMHCDYPGSRPTRNNVIRWCVSEKDGRKTGKSGGGFDFVSWGEGIENSQVYNCTVFIVPTSSSTVAGLSSFVVTGYGGANPHLASCSFRNNIVFLQGAGMVQVNNQISGADKVVYQGNRYHATDASSLRWLDGGGTYTALAAWRSAKGQERLNAADVGSTGDPLLTAPGGGGAITDPRALPDSLTAYRLQYGSPCVNAGLDLLALFSVNPGPRDFYGNAIPQRGGFDIGAHEVLPDVTPPAPGTVNDGTGADIDTQVSTTSISATWSGFSDPESGILGYHWAVGTTTGGQDVRPFTSVGTATSATAELSLTGGATYYVTVRATNGAGLAVERSSDGVTIIKDSCPVPLAAGYTLIALPLDPGPLTAEGLGQMMNASGAGCTSVVAYDTAAGAFVTHPVGTAVGNFAVEVGKGYFVRCVNAVTWQMQGYRLNGWSKDVKLAAGYNLVSLPLEPEPPARYTAERVGQEIDADGGGCTSVIEYRDGAFRTHPMGTAVENFTVVTGRGYFVRCTQPSTWTARR